MARFGRSSWRCRSFEDVFLRRGFPQEAAEARRVMKFFQKLFDSLKTRSYIHATDGDDALRGRLAIRFSRVSQAHASWPKGWGESGSVFSRAQAFAVTIRCLTIESEERETWTAESLRTVPSWAVEETL
jgi:hypothetical protein